MTDREMALALGKKILGLLNENAAIAAILKAMKQPDGVPVPWHQMMREGVAALESSPTFLYKCDELQQAIPVESDPHLALALLYQHFLG
jgi:hypothetical protein